MGHMSKHYNDELCRIIEPEFAKFMARADQIRWSPENVPYDKIDRAKLTDADLFAVFVTLHIENYSDVYTKLLLKHYADTPVLRDFIVNWESEEENHARVLERYLITLGIPLDELRANYAKVDKNDFPFPSTDQTGLNVFVFFQELLTREMYTKILKSCREPVLVDILKRVVRDEERHYRFYKQALDLRLKLDRRDTYKQFLAIIRLFGMPQTMFRQKAMTDQLITYYHYDFGEIGNIAQPVAKFLEASPSRWLSRSPRLQKLWQSRRSFVFLAQSPYLWEHVLQSVMSTIGWSSVPQKDKDYVQSVVSRLHCLLNLGEVAIHDGLASSGLGVGDGLVASGAHAVR